MWVGYKMEMDKIGGALQSISGNGNGNGNGN
jgi:hypothetical protein